MSHEIRSTDAMLYVGETPWHKLGISLTTPPATIAEAMALCGLDWHVTLRNLSTEDHTSVEHRAVRRDSDGRVLGVVGPRWRPIQNVEAFAPLQPFIDAGQCAIETMGSLFDGGRVWALARVNRDPMTIVPGDDVAKYMLLANGHDGSMTMRVGFTPVRVVCQNTLSMSIAKNAGSKLIRIRHTQGAQKALADVCATIDMANAGFEATADQYRALARKQVNAADLRSFIKVVFPPPPAPPPAPAKRPSEPEIVVNVCDTPALQSILDANYTGQSAVAGSVTLEEIADETSRDKDARCVSILEELFVHGQGNAMAGVRGTAWAAYNAVSEYVTHSRGRSDEGRANALFAEGGKILDRALVAASRMAS
jgi:phage/plasmid-like protein (TIGR03299 family)